MPNVKRVERRRYSDDPKVDLASREARAFSHPARARILAILNQQPAASSELNGRIEGHDLAGIAYHVRVLHELGMIEPVRSEKGKRGRRKTIYRACRRMLLDDDDWAVLGSMAKSDLTNLSVDAIAERTQRALAAETIDSRADRHLSTITLPVDAEGWADVMEVLRTALSRVIEIEAASAARVANGWRAVQGHREPNGLRVPLTKA